jgi:hypothetical protein
VERKVGSSVETGLRKVENASEADDEPVDFSEGGEAKDFGRVVAVMMSVSTYHVTVRTGDLRHGGVVEGAV